MLQKRILSAIVLFSFAFLSACASRSVMPDVEELTVKREAPDQDCKSLGPVTGSTLSARGTSEEALEDMKKLAASKGANYLWVKQYSDTGTSVTGEAFECP